MMKRSRQDALRLAVAIGLSASLLYGGNVEALPTGEHTRSGGVEIDKSVDRELTVRQSTQRAAIDWKTFDIGKDESGAF